MADNLPNELVQEILWPGLHVPDEMLHDISDLSPFAHPCRQPASSVLQVCKQWNAVGTPLLYHVVVLRSKAQAYSLERTFRNRGELGLFVKKLRVEGGYGIVMRKILTLSRNIKDFGVSLNLRASDSEKGLINAFHTINPTTFTLLDPRPDVYKLYKPIQSLASAIALNLRNWTNLVCYGTYIQRCDSTEILIFLAGGLRIETFFY